ncbi:MAG: YccF domain-containing protein [Ilumatobacteraceae bacterium]
MRATGNILWFIPGLLTAIGHIIGGALLCITIVGFPFAVQAFKLAGLSLAPFGKKIVKSSNVEVSVR